MKKFLIINLFILLILTTLINTVSATIITDDILNNNISKINLALQNQENAKNPNYLTELLDENGNVPPYQYYPNSISSRSIKALKAYDGKIFMGIGDWNANTGPAKIIYYDTDTIYTNNLPLNDNSTILLLKENNKEPLN